MIELAAPGTPPLLRKRFRINVDFLVLEAYLAFKGVRLDRGTHVVSFTFHDGIRTLAQKTLLFSRRWARLRHSQPSASSCSRKGRAIALSPPSGFHRMSPSIS